MSHVDTSRFTFTNQNMIGYDRAPKPTFNHSQKTL